MVGILLLFLLLWAALIVLLWAGSVFLQGYIYSEPAEGMYWRAPAAGTAITLVLALWCLLDYRSPGNYPAAFVFSPKDSSRYRELWAVNNDGKTIHFDQRTDATGRKEYRDDTNRPLFSRPQAVIVKEDGEEVRFEPDRDGQGKLKTTPGSPLRYTDPRGRVMTEDQIGEISTMKWGLAFANIFLNVFLFAVLFAGLWLVLQYQWSHALGLAVVGWLVLGLLVVSMLTTKVEEAAAKRAPTTSGETG